MQELQYPFDAALILQNCRRIKKKLLAESAKRVHKRIAVLGGSTTHDIVRVLELFLLDAGIEPEFYESEYGQYYQDAMFGNDELDGFAPDLIFIHTTNRNLTVPYPTMTDSRQQVNALINEQMAYYIGMWQTIRERYHCTVIQNNFEFPLYRLMGNKDATDYRGRVRFLNQLNSLFADYAAKQQDFYIHDIQYLSADYGLQKWQDPFFWYMYKYALCLPAIPVFAYSLANMIKSIFGKNKKALALDLDNTLWGGVVGDDGVDGIEIGQETPLGQGFCEFQTYIRQLRDLGVILNVASKNEPENAIAGLNHPAGILRPDDFAVIQANWNAKSDNIADIASSLNILPESMVFVDDNPAEREIVRGYVSGIAVPEVNRVEDYIQTIDRAGYFEVTAYSEDDGKRNEMYQANFRREQAQAAYTNYDEYLTSLAMKAEIRDFQPVYLARITQLTNKSNQFNVTTRRYTTSEMETISRDPAYLRLYGKLEDRFGDNGIVSVVIGKKQGTVLHLDLWLMSCRVLKRDMEYAMLDTLVAHCREAKIEEIVGYYYPTAKNKMVQSLFADFGFSCVSEDDMGNTVWTLSVDRYRPKNRFICVNGKDEA